MNIESRSRITVCVTVNIGQMEIGGNVEQSTPDSPPPPLPLPSQGLLTTGYIILLSRVGERVASDMRKTLFAALLR